MHTVSKSEFKPQALEYLRLVEEKNKPIVITHFGKPVVQIIPYNDNVEKDLKNLRKTVTTFIKPTDPIDTSWEALV